MDQSHEGRLEAMSYKERRTHIIRKRTRYGKTWTKARFRKRRGRRHGGRGGVRR